MNPPRVYRNGGWAQYAADHDLPQDGCDGDGGWDDEPETAYGQCGTCGRNAPVADLVEVGVNDGQPQYECAECHEPGLD